MGISGGPDIVQDGLVLELDAADKNSYPGSGTTWRDLSGNANNGTLTNGPTFNSGNAGSIVFDGVDDYVTIPQSNSLKFGTGNFTLLSWIYPTSVANSRVIENRGTSPGAGYPGYQFKVQQNGSTWRIFNSGIVGLTNFTVVDSNNYYPMNSWYQITMIYINNSELIFYVNGNLDTTGNTAVIGDIDNLLPVNIGATDYNLGTPSTLSQPFGGSIATTQIYNRALTASEILQNYNATKTRFGL